MKHTEPVLLTHFVHRRTVEAMEEEFDLYRLWEATDREALIEDLAPSLRIIAGGAHCKEPFLSRFPKLSLITNYAVGYDNIDLAYCGRHGVRVTNTPGVLDDEVADTAIGLLLCLTKNINSADKYLREGRWLEGPMPLGLTLKGKTMGIVGLGRIGKRIAALAQAHLMHVVYHTRSPKDVPYPYYKDLGNMAKDVDILMLVVPGGPDTRHLVNLEILEKLGPKGLLVNVARGSVVDEGAMIEALQRGFLGGAALDVFEDEPRVPQALLDLGDRVVLTPHIGSGTEETRSAMGRLMMDNIHAFFQGKSLISEVPETADIIKT